MSGPLLLDHSLNVLILALLVIALDVSGHLPIVFVEFHLLGLLVLLLSLLSFDHGAVVEDDLHHVVLHMILPACIRIAPSRCHFSFQEQSVAGSWHGFFSGEAAGAGEVGGSAATRGHGIGNWVEGPGVPVGIVVAVGGVEWNSTLRGTRLVVAGARSTHHFVRRVLCSWKTISIIWRAVYYFCSDHFREMVIRTP